MSSTTSEIAGVDLGRLADWMDGAGIGEGPITEVRALTGGTQNILVRLRRGDRDLVLRRPPLAKPKRGDETMRREARVLEVLRDTDVPHPALVGLCADPDVLGAAFYLMAPVDGYTPNEGLTEPTASDEVLQRRLGLSMVDSLAALGRVDFRERGLETLGRADGWLERQVGRWRAQLDSYRELAGYPGPQLPNVDGVARWLERRQPSRWQPGLIHGDVHFANVIVDHAEPQIAALVDWELSTIGDPLLDLSHLLAHWPVPGQPTRLAIPAAPGMPRPPEVVERYAEQSGRDVSDMTWFRVLACYRLGIILEGSNARAYAGTASRDIGDRLGARATELFELATTLIESDPA